MIVVAAGRRQTADGAAAVAAMRQASDAIALHRRTEAEAQPIVGRRHVRRALRTETEGAQRLADRVDRTEARRLRIERFGDLAVGRVIVVHAVHLRVQNLRANGNDERMGGMNGIRIRVVP